MQSNGQFAGAFYGVEGIPEAWREQIARREEIVRLAAVVFEDAGETPVAS